MPPQQGESLLLTHFADIHYYFAPPTSRPVHHRFDRTSYVYLYHQPTHNRGRLEIANHAGTPEQDAFMGNLDGALVQYSYKHPTLFTIVVDGASTSAPGPDPSQWHLPAADPRNEGKYMYRLHTLDLYFWTKEDALVFLDSLQKFLPDHQLRVSDAPAVPQEHRDSMSPVVQKLEKAAVSTKLAQRSSSVSTTNSGIAPPSFPGPPTSATPSSVAPATESNYAPVAYNPAAPAAPEPIAHREKTPPPMDAVAGTGLQAAAVHDHGYQPGYGQPQQQYYQQQPGYLPGPPPQPGIQRANTSHSLTSHSSPTPPGQVSGPSAGPSPYTPGPPTAAAHSPEANPNAQWLPQPGGLQRQSTMPAGQVGYGSSTPTPPPAQTQYANYPQNPSFAPPPVQSPGYNPASHGPGQAQQQHAGGTPPPPPQPLGGYSGYSYGQPGTQTQGQAAGYDIHSLAYRPTQEEIVHGAREDRPTKAGGGKLEQKIGKVEKGFGRFLKKLDEKI